MSVHPHRNRLPAEAMRRLTAELMARGERPIFASSDYGKDRRLPDAEPRPTVRRVVIDG